MNRQRNNSFKQISILAAIAVFVFGAIYAGISLTKNVGKSEKVITNENAMEVLDKLYKGITVNKVQARKAPVSLETTDRKNSMPDISKYPAQIENTTDSYIEIFSSTEKTGEKNDGWLKEVAQDFNNSNIEVNGNKVSVRVRGLASGTGMDYILTGKYMPDAFTPSNELWGEMLKANGTKASLIEKKLLGNVAGVLTSKKKNDELVKKYGSINLKNITTAVENNEIAMGYTNPFTSSTGLNFLISTLSTFDGKDLLGSKAVEGFEKFQSNIPFVSYTTLQMRESAKSGVLDGFIMEYQTFINSPELTSDYVFTTFGVRHDSPLYSIGELSPEKKEILNKFVQFCKGEKYQNLAVEYGFNKMNDYISEIGEIKGDTIIQAQKLWKEKKNGDSDLTAVFVADISGSMYGAPINNLKKSLLSGSQFISKESSIGLVTFSTDVNINLPIGKFDINQRSLFTGAVNNMYASGKTAMYDAIVVASKMLMEEKSKNPNAKLMLFVLTDGVTNVGSQLIDVQDMLKTFQIPIYAIGYNANIKELQNLSSINEAASINADTDDVIYQLENLFNAQM